MTAALANSDSRKFPGKRSRASSRLDILDTYVDINIDTLIHTYVGTYIDTAIFVSQRLRRLKHVGILVESSFVHSTPSAASTKACFSEAEPGRGWNVSMVSPLLADGEGRALRQNGAKQSVFQGSVRSHGRLL